MMEYLSTNLSLLARAATELESLREFKISDKNTFSSSTSSSSSTTTTTTIAPTSIIACKFPTACLNLVRRIPGNLQCFDCNNPNPEWASITYGTLYCMRCCGRHRSYGVNISYMKSIVMDDWNQKQILALLEGGNHQLQTFFTRHQMDTIPINQRYYTKAAKFYKIHLAKHIESVYQHGVYQGREMNRKNQQQQPMLRRRTHSANEAIIVSSQTSSSSTTKTVITEREKKNWADDDTTTTTNATTIIMDDQSAASTSRIRTIPSRSHSNTSNSSNDSSSFVDHNNNTTKQTSSSSSTNNLAVMTCCASA